MSTSEKTYRNWTYELKSGKTRNMSVWRESQIFLIMCITNPNVCVYAGVQLYEPNIDVTFSYLHDQAAILH